jgi:hypothetical protein
MSVNTAFHRLIYHSRCGLASDTVLVPIPDDQHLDKIDDAFADAKSLSWRRLAPLPVAGFERKRAGSY